MTSAVAIDAPRKDSLCPYGRLDFATDVGTATALTSGTSLRLGECSVQSRRYSFHKLVNFVVGRSSG